jgi:hypothetical protein
MMFFFTALVALGALEGWLIHNIRTAEYRAGPLALGGALAIVTALLDRRVGRILRSAYHSGRCNERKWQVSGTYSAIACQGEVRMTTILCVTYWTFAAVLLTAAAVVIITTV